MVPARMISAQAAVWFYLATFSLPFDIDIGMLGLAIVGSITALSAPPRFPSGALPKLLVFLTLTIGVGNFTSPDIHRSLHLSLSLIPACAVYLLISGYFGRRQLVGLCMAIALVLCGLGSWLLEVAATHPGMSPTEWIRQSRLTAFKVPNDILFFQILLPFPLALLKLEPWFTPQRWLVWTAVGIAIALAVFYNSRLAVLVAGTSITFFFLLLGESKTLLRVGTTALLGLLLLDAALGFKLTTKFLTSWTSRLPLWLAAWRMFLDAPLTGHGIGSYLALYRDYLNPSELSDWIVYDPRTTPWAHNLYLEILAELGLTGLCAFGMMLSSAFGLHPSRNPSQAVIASAALAALSAFCLSALFELSFWRQWVGLVFMLILGTTTKQREGTLWQHKQKSQTFQP